VTTKENIKERIAAGRLPITLANIEIVTAMENQPASAAINLYSKNAGLTIIGFHEEIIKHDPIAFFNDFNDIGDILFVNASEAKEIN